MKAEFKFETFNQATEISLPLRYELNSIAQSNDSKYWFALGATFMVDKVKIYADGTTAYFVRRPRSKSTVILQSNWAGMEFFKIAN